MSFDRISRRLETYRNAMVDLQIKLGAIPAIAPSSGGEGEAKKAEFLVGYLRENGFTDIEVIKAPDLDSALDWARQATVACKGPVEVRPLQDESED